jgi:hypothetical protein
VLATLNEQLIVCDVAKFTAAVPCDTLFSLMVTLATFAVRNFLWFDPGGSADRRYGGHEIHPHPETTDLR